MINYLNTHQNLIFQAFLTIIIILIYDLIKNYRKLFINIINLKINIQNKDNWKNDNIISDNTKEIDIDFILEIYNHKNTYTSVYNFKVIKKNKFKFKSIQNNNLNLNNTAKSLSGSIAFDKLKYITLLPYEIKTYNIKIKLTKDEYLSIKKNPIYIFYKKGLKKQKIKLNKYLRKKK